MPVLINILLTVVIVSFSAWLSGRFPRLAGFIVALPLSTLLVLLMSQAQHRDPAVVAEFAKSIFVAVPITLGFLVPFMMARRWGLSFWACYGIGCSLIVVGYFAHRFLMRVF